MFRFTLITLLAGLLLAAPAAAQQTGAEETHAEIALLSGKQAMLVVRALVSGGRYDDARRFVADWSRGHPDAEFRRRFVDGLIAGHSGDHAGAVRIYRSLLAERPGLDLVRVELTRSLVANGDYGAARGQADRLIAAGVDDKLGGGLGRLVSVLKERRPVQLRGYVSLLPSTNINGGTDRDTVPLGDLDLTIDPDAKRKSGVGALFGGEVLIRKPLTPSVAFVSTLSAIGRFYPSVDRELVDIDAAAGFVRERGRASILVAGIAGGSLSEWDETSRYGGVKLEVKTPLSPSWRMFASHSLRYERFANLPAKDGWRAETSLSVDRIIDTTRFVRLIAGYAGARKNEARFSYDEVSAGLGFFGEFPAGIALYTQATAARRQYRGLYPGLPEAQRDIRLSGLAVLTKRDFAVAGFAPQLSYRFERNLSNAAFEDTTRHEIDLRLTRDF